MSKIIKFKQEDETCTCPSCGLVWEHISDVADSESYEELFDALKTLVEEAKILGLKEHLEVEISMKSDLLDHLEFDCDGSCEDFCDKCFDDKEYDC